MADQKISQLNGGVPVTDAATIADDDLLPFVDVSDTSQAASGTTKPLAVAALGKLAAKWEGRGYAEYNIVGPDGTKSDANPGCFHTLDDAIAAIEADGFNTDVFHFAKVNWRTPHYEVSGRQIQLPDNMVWQGWVRLEITGGTEDDEVHVFHLGNGNSFYDVQFWSHSRTLRGFSCYGDDVTGTIFRRCMFTGYFDTGQPGTNRGTHGGIYLTGPSWKILGVEDCLTNSMTRDLPMFRVENTSGSMREMDVWFSRNFMDCYFTEANRPGNEALPYFFGNIYFESIGAGSAMRACRMDHNKIRGIGPHYTGIRLNNTRCRMSHNHFETSMRRRHDQGLPQNGLDLWMNRDSTLYEAFNTWGHDDGGSARVFIGGTVQKMNMDIAAPGRATVGAHGRILDVDGTDLTA